MLDRVKEWIMRISFGRVSSVSMAEERGHNNRGGHPRPWPWAVQWSASVNPVNTLYRMHRTVITLLALLGAVSCTYYPAAWRRPAVASKPGPSCVLGDQLSYLPMFIVPENKLTVLQDYRTIYYTTAPAFVSFAGQRQQLPAVRVVLTNPIPVSSWKTFIEFPSSFTIFQDGYQLPFPVSALYAPLSEQEILRRPFVDIVYAVPSALTTPSRLIQPTPSPPQTTQAPLPYPPRQNVTVLHFPESLAQPQVVYQEITDDELGGRNPPLPVVPAGIVQSAAPTPDVTFFVNSKESPILQALREEADRARQKSYLAARNYY